MSRAGKIANIAWPAPPDPERFDGAGVVIRSLRHHVAAANTVTIGPPHMRESLNEAWRALQQLRDNPALPVVHACLDQVRARFATVRTAASPSMMEQRRVG